MSVQSKVDDWFTAGNNWRFITLVGGVALIVIVLVFGSIIKKRAGEISQIAMIAAKPDPQTGGFGCGRAYDVQQQVGFCRSGEVPGCCKVPRVIDFMKQYPEQKSVPKPLDYVVKKVHCKRMSDGSSGRCWDPKTNRWTYLGKLR